MPKPSTKTPAFLDAARAFYGEAFEHHTKRDLSRSIAEWGEMEQDEQSFAVAHLLYLNLQAQAAGQKLLTQVRDLLDEVAEGLTTAIEASLAEPDEGGGEDIDADDLAPGSVPAGDRAAQLEVVDDDGDDEPEEYEIDGDDASEGAE